MTRVSVVGAGITGLATAFSLLHDDIDVDLIEASGRVGGKVLTSTVHGIQIDAGADAFLVRDPHMTELCEDLNIRTDLVPPRTGNAFVWSQGALRPLPSRLYLGIPFEVSDLEASGLLTPSGLERATQDLTQAANGPATDESVGSLVRRRLGNEVMERVVAPLLGGINAGDADQLSLQGGMPNLAHAASHDPSLIKSIRKHLELLKGDPSSPVFLTHPKGIGQIINVLYDHVKHRTHINQSVNKIEQASDGWRILARESFDAKAVVLTTPSFISAELLADTAPTASKILAEIEYASVVIATFAFAACDVSRFEGSGFLVARDEGLMMTACSWSSSKWSHLGEGPIEFIRVSAGHIDDNRPFELPDDELVERLLQELQWLIDLNAEPLEVRVTRWPKSLPQYHPGHLERVATINEALTAEAPGIKVAGAAYHGLGLPACVHQARKAAEWARNRIEHQYN